MNHSKRLLWIALGTAALSACSSAQKTPETAKAPEPAGPKQVWSATHDAVSTPESAYYHAESDTVFISNVSGTPNQKDGKGWISKFDTSGKIIQAQWVTGLNAPKGMRADNKGTLWVTDIDQVLGIELKTGKVKNRVKVNGAKFLNDVAIGPKGEVYVSDMFTSTIHVVKNGKASTFMSGEKLESPNGLLIVENKLIVAGWGTGTKSDFSVKSPGHLYSIDLKTKKKQLISQELTGNLDGLEMKDGNYYVSDWVAGKVYQVDKHGISQVLLEGFKGSADLGIVPEKNTIIVPRMGEDQVTAYEIKG